ncbi:hypothetical protein [Burkholderia sp. PU8-34]
MAADTPSRCERRLRSAVAELAHRPVADIEAVWHALTEEERTQLGPLLAEAASALSETPLAFVSAPQTATPIGHGDASHSDDAPALLARLAGHWPDVLLIRAVRPFGNAHLDSFLSRVPADRRATLSQQPASPPITPQAHEALMQAARHDAHTLPAPASIDDQLADTARMTWTQRQLRTIRGGRN